MTSKQEALEAISNGALKGTLVLNASEALGIEDVFIVVTNKTEQKKHILLNAELLKKQLLPGGKAEHAFSISSADETGEIGAPLPGRRKRRNEICEHEGCDWLVRSERISGGDWIEKTRRCVSDAPCPYNKIVKQP